MILKPQSQLELSQQLASASAAMQRISGSDLSSLSALLEHHPEDMTATVEAGMTLARFQSILRPQGQWLPIDPPNPESLTVGDLLAANLSGPRRLGYGTIRDYLIGIRVALADGQLIRAGGKVVKNVAGYDLCKLFTGARHSLGLIVEASFKLLPLPESERFVHAQVASLADLHKVGRSLLASPSSPVILDAHNLEGRLTLVAAFAGNREDVAAQLALATSLGFSEISSPSYHADFWRDGDSQKISVLPSETIESIESLQPAQFLAHFGNGIIFYRGGRPAPEPRVHVELMERVKNAYDPHHILPLYAA